MLTRPYMLCCAAQAMAVIDRIHRALAHVSEHIFNKLDPVARAYGDAFGVDSWAVALFAEEVIRGGPAFAVSLVLSRWGWEEERELASGWQCQLAWLAGARFLFAAVCCSVCVQCGAVHGW